MFYSDRIDAREPVSPDRARAADAGSVTPGLFDPVYLAGEIWKARIFLVFMLLLGCVLAAAYAFSVPKQYTATSQLVIDPRDLNLVQNEVTVTPNGMTTDATLALIESQIAVMTSNSVLGRVVTQASLTADPEFNGTRTSLLSGVTSTIGALFSIDPETAIRNRELVTINALREHVTAFRNANSFVINLSVETEDPEKSARLANLMTEIFIAEQGRAQSDVARRATASLSSRLAELRQRVVETEGAVETYKAENQLVGVGGRLIDDDYITRINNQLADVRAQITALNVRAESLRNARVDDVVGGSYPEGLNAESLLRLRQTYSEAAQNEAILAARLGPRHPQRIASEQSLTTARRAIQAELSRIVASAQTELARARQTERDLTTQIDALRSRQIETSGAFVRLRELEREVDASRAVYEAYLLRARQTSEQESINTANVRVISDATVPFDPSSVSRKIVLAAGGIVGLGVGIALAGLGAMLRAGRAAPSGRIAAARAGIPTSSVADRQTVSVPQAERPDEPAATPAERIDADPRQEPAEAIDLHPAPILDTPASTDLRRETADGSIPVAAGWSLRGPSGDLGERHPVGAETIEPPVASVDEPHDVDEAATDDLDQRREGLRDRIRAIGARRTLASPSLDRSETAAHDGSDGSVAEAARERISLSIALARSRRAGPPITTS